MDKRTCLPHWGAAPVPHMLRAPATLPLLCSLARWRAQQARCWLLFTLQHSRWWQLPAWPRVSAGRSSAALIQGMPRVGCALGLPSPPSTSYRLLMHPIPPARPVQPSCLPWHRSCRAWRSPQRRLPAARRRRAAGSSAMAQLTCVRCCASRWLPNPLRPIPGSCRAIPTSLCFAAAMRGSCRQRQPRPPTWRRPAHGLLRGAPSRLEPARRGRPRAALFFLN